MPDAEKKPRQQDPIRAAASRVADAKKRWAALVARAGRLDADAKRAQEAIPPAELAVQAAEEGLQQVLARTT